MRRLLLGLSLGLAFVSTGLVARRAHHANEAWSDARLLADELQRSLEGADGRRPVLYGEALEGRAHEDYARAVSLLDPSVDDDWIAYRVARMEDGDLSDSVRDRMVEGHVGALAALAQGAHRLDAGWDVDWDAGYDKAFLDVMDYRALVNLAVLAAHQHLDEGSPDRAVESLLDGMQLSRDLLHRPVLNSKMIGCALLSIAGKEALIDDGLLERLPPSELARLADGMRALDSSLSLSSRASAGELVLFVRTVDQLDSAADLPQTDPVGVLRAWSDGSSGRRMSAAFVQGSAERLEVSSGAEGLPWPERSKAVTSFDERLGESANPILHTIAPRLRSAEEWTYGAVAAYRLARAAVEARLTDRAPRLPDPFGGELRVTEVADGLRIESRGPAGDFRADRYRIELAR